MVIRGNTRGNGEQLGHYLLTVKDNDDVQILDVAGRHYASEEYLHQTIYSMQLNSELTNSSKGLYHAQINPAHDDAKQMAHDDWLKAADILGKELGLENQRRIIVLHEKKARIHAHVVWERYDYDTGKIKSDSFSRLAQDRARLKMEEEFGHANTPKRNKHRPELKEALTVAWLTTKDGREFIKQAEQLGYLVAEGSMRHPFMVVDKNGRSFDLVRQLKGIRIKEVRERMRHEQLTSEKEAIELMRKRQAGGDGDQGGSFSEVNSTKSRAISFASNRDEAIQLSEEYSFDIRKRKMAKNFRNNSEEIKDRKSLEEVEEQLKKFKLAKEFTQNRNDEVTSKDVEIVVYSAHQQDIEKEFSENLNLSEREKLKQKFIEEQKEITEEKYKRNFRI